MKIVFLDAGTMGDTPLTSIEALGELHTYWSSTPEEARERVRDADVAIVNKVRVNAEFLAAAPKLRLVCEAGTGINNIDVDLCTERGIHVRNVAGYSTDSVAQTTWMHILNLAGKAFYYDNKVKSGSYSQGSIHTDSSTPFMELAGKTLGIVGMGAIGQQVARVAVTFGMKVIYFSTSGTAHCKDYPAVPIETLLAESDIISINAPYNERTANLIDYEGFRKMKRTAYLVNTGRGGIAVEADLARALDDGLIAGAALDVYVTEPIPMDNPLMHLKDPSKLIFSPHIAWSSREARQRLADEMAANIRKGW